jgi:hypothetical protein
MEKEQQNEWLALTESDIARNFKEAFGPKSVTRDSVTPVDPRKIEDDLSVHYFTHDIIKRGRTLDPVDAYQDALLAAQVLLHILEDRS